MNWRYKAEKEEKEKLIKFWLWKTFRLLTICWEFKSSTNNYWSPNMICRISRKLCLLISLEKLFPFAGHRKGMESIYKWCFLCMYDDCVNIREQGFGKERTIDGNRKWCTNENLYHWLFVSRIDLCINTLDGLWKSKSHNKLWWNKKPFYMAVELWRIVSVWRFLWTWPSIVHRTFVGLYSRRTSSVFWETENDGFVLLIINL